MNPPSRERSRMNALKHGLRATDEIFIAHLKPAERATFDEFRTSLHESYAPQTYLEKLLVDQIAIQHFRQLRLYRLEDAALRKSLAAVATGRRPFDDASSVVPHLERFSRYDWRIERQLTILLDKLRQAYVIRELAAKSKPAVE